MRIIFIIVAVFSLSVFAISDAPSFGYSVANNRQSYDTILTRSNVNGLKLKWSYPVKGPAMASTIVATVNGRDIVYIATTAGELHAIIRTTGARLWKKDLSLYTGKYGSSSRTTAAYFNGIIVIGDQQGCQLIAVDANTGAKKWSKTLDPHPYCRFTQSPTISKTGFIYIGTSSNEEYQSKVKPGYQCCTFMGGFYKLQLSTGALAWSMRSLPNNGGQVGGYSGNAFWGSSPALDYGRNRVFVATGNNYQVPQSVKNCINAASPSNKTQCIAANNYVNSILSLDMSTGAVVWAKRVSGPDVFNLQCTSNCVGNGYAKDIDFGQGVLLTSIVRNGVRYDGLIAVQKSGTVWCFNRAYPGSLLWSTNVNANSLSFGSAVDANNVYIAVSDGGLNYKMRNGQACNTGHWVALNKNTGAFVWERCNPGTLNVGAPVTVTTSGLLFVSAYDGKMYALSTANGATLWSTTVGSNLKSSGPTVTAGMVISGHGYRENGEGTTYIKAYGL